MSTVLYVIGNPEPARSSFTQELLDHIDQLEHLQVEIILLSEHLHDGRFLVNEMQAQLERAEALVIHAPVYWYGAPAIVKSWMDQTLTPGWAFPSHNSKLRGKSIALSLTIGASLESYQPGEANNHTLSTYFLPYRQAFEYCGMEWKGIAASQVPSTIPTKQAALEQFEKTQELFNEQG